MNENYAVEPILKNAAADQIRQAENVILVLGNGS
jgi:hypothetical protein